MEPGGGRVNPQISKPAAFAPPRRSQSEEILLGEARPAAEVHAPEMGDGAGAPAFESVAAGHRLQDPHVHGEGLQAIRAEEEHAVGDLFPDPGQEAQPLARLGVGQGAGFLQPARPLGQELRGAVDVARAEAEPAGLQLRLGDQGQAGPGGQGPACRRAREEGRPVALGQESGHLLDLDDPFRRAAEEAKQGFPERLAEDAQARPGGETAGQMGIAAPGQGVRQFAGVASSVEVLGQGGSGLPRGIFRGGPFHGSAGDRVVAQPGHVAGPAALPLAAGLAVPAEGLPAVEHLREHLRRRRHTQRQRPPGGPAQPAYSGLAQRKLSWEASTWPSASTRSSFQATG